MHTRARDNALMSGRWNQRMKIMYQGVGICFRIPKALDWHMFRFILHNVHMLDKRQENGRFCPFLYQDSLLGNVSLPLSPSYLATYAKANQADMDKIAPLCRKHERSLP